jgi:hypothetical protein
VFLCRKSLGSDSTEERFLNCDFSNVGGEAERREGVSLGKGAAGKKGENVIKQTPFRYT